MLGFWLWQDNLLRRVNQVLIKLKLDWQEIAGQSKSTNLVSSPDSVSTDINALVQEVREKVKEYIQERCGTMRVLDMAQPIGLGDIYTDVNILEKITGSRRLDISKLLQNSKIELDDYDDFSRHL